MAEQKVIYSVRSGEDLDEIVENTATIDTQAAYDNGFEQLVQFPGGTTLRLDDLRTHWFLSRWDSGDMEPA